VTQPEDWRRVVAVFTQGNEWQFEDYPAPYNDLSKLFSMITCFYLQLSSTPLPAIMNGWQAVKKLAVNNGDKNQMALLKIWDEVNKSVAQNPQCKRS
jgi:hypothetical protein